MGRGGKLEWVAMDPAFQKSMKAEASRVFPKTMKALEKHAQILKAGVEENWPEKTGRSKAAFRIEVQVTSKGPRLLVLNTAKNAGKHYALYVDRGWPMKEFLFKPAMRARKQILEDIAGELTK